MDATNRTDFVVIQFTESGAGRAVKQKLVETLSRAGKVPNVQSGEVIVIKRTDLRWCREKISRLGLDRSHITICD